MCKLTKNLPIQGVVEFSGAVEDLTRGGETFWGVGATLSARQSYVYILSVSYSSTSAAKFMNLPEEIRIWQPNFFGGLNRKSPPTKFNSELIPNIASKNLKTA